MAHPTRLIYLDTNLWNRLLDQHANPTALLSGLEQSGSSLALSGQTVYELARTFQSAPERGKELFRYVRAYVDAGIVGAYDNKDLLRAEVKALYDDAGSVVAYYSQADYDALKAEVGKLSEGIVDQQAQTFVSERMAFTKETRKGQKTIMEKRPDMRARLLAIPEDRLTAWLDQEVSGDDGAIILMSHLMHIFESAKEDAAYSTALGLLQHPASRMAKAVVRFDLYSAWRCAHRGSNPRDLLDDMYHVLNAAYCDVYATADAGQMSYAPVLLNQWTRPVAYDGGPPLADWLLSV
jgi:hypothetical protein